MSFIVTNCLTRYEHDVIGDHHISVVPVINNANIAVTTSEVGGNTSAIQRTILKFSMIAGI
jgi:hypothetical protein